MVKNDFGEVYGYCRVSTKDQKEDRQLDAMLDYGVQQSHIFVEHISGKNFNHPEYKKMIRILRRGDILVIKSIDRLGRNYDEILSQWRMLTTDIGVGIHVIDMPTLNTSGDPSDLLSKFITDLMLQVLSYVAENERETTIKRQKEGIEAAKKRGNVKLGRPKTKIPFDFWEVYIAWKTGKVAPKDLIAMCKKEFGIGSRMFYRRIRELDTRFGDIAPDKLRDLIVEDDFSDGFEFSAERCDAALGVYNSYTNNPVTLARSKQKREEENLHSEEALKRSILQRRQEDFKQRFGVDDLAGEIVRGRNATKPKPSHVMRTTVID